MRNLARCVLRSVTYSSTHPSRTPCEREPAFDGSCGTLAAAFPGDSRAVRIFGVLRYASPPRLAAENPHWVGVAEPRCVRRPFSELLREGPPFAAGPAWGMRIGGDEDKVWCCAEHGRPCARRSERGAPQGIEDGGLINTPAPAQWPRVAACRRLQQRVVARRPCRSERTGRRAPRPARTPLQGARARAAPREARRTQAART